MMYYLIPIILVLLLAFQFMILLLVVQKNVWYISVLAFILGIFVPLLVASLNSYYGIKREKGGQKPC